MIRSINLKQGFAINSGGLRPKAVIQVNTRSFSVLMKENSIFREVANNSRLVLHPKCKSFVKKVWPRVFYPRWFIEAHSLGSGVARQVAEQISFPLMHVTTITWSSDKKFRFFACMGLIKSMKNHVTIIFMWSIIVVSNQPKNNNVNKIY